MSSDLPAEAGTRIWRPRTLVAAGPAAGHPGAAAGAGHRRRRRGHRVRAAAFSAAPVGRSGARAGRRSAAIFGLPRAHGAAVDRWGAPAVHGPTFSGCASTPRPAPAPASSTRPARPSAPSERWCSAARSTPVSSPPRAVVTRWPPRPQHNWRRCRRIARFAPWTSAGWGLTGSSACIPGTAVRRPASSPACPRGVDNTLLWVLGMFCAVGALALIGATVVGVWIIRRQLAPAVKVSAAARDVADRELDREGPVATGDRTRRPRRRAHRGRAAGFGAQPHAGPDHRRARGPPCQRDAGAAIRGRRQSRTARRWRRSAAIPNWRNARAGSCPPMSPTR